MTPDTAFALVLLLTAAFAGLAVQNGGARLYVDIAAVLYAILASVALLLPDHGQRAGTRIALCVMAAAPGALSLAGIATLATVPQALAAAGLGLSILAGAASLVFPQVALVAIGVSMIATATVSILHLIARPREATMLLLSALALGAASSALAAPGPSGQLLFLSVALLGTALAARPRARRSGARVDARTWPRRSLGIRGKR